MITLPDVNNIILFLTAASILIIIPGPAVLYIMTKSMEQGYKAGIVSVIGIGVGGLFHIVAASIGISTILVTSATAFSILKYLGAFYLIYLGVKKLFDKKPFIQDFNFDKRQKLFKIFYEGVLVNVFNPKTAIFFFAFLPQFVSIEKGGITSQILFLGLLFLLIAIFSDTLYVLISGKIAIWMKNSPMYIRFHKYFTCAIYIFLGLITLSVNQTADYTTSKK